MSRSRALEGRMHTATSTGGTDLVMVRESHSGPVCQQVEHTLPPLVLPETMRLPTIGCGHVHKGAMAKRAFLCLPSPPPHAPVSGESQSGAVEGHFSGSQSAISPVVRGSSSDHGGFTVAHPPNPGGALSQEKGAIQTLPSLGQPLQARLLKGTGEYELV